MYCFVFYDIVVIVFK